MKPHIEEAWRALRLADRDIKVFDILVDESEAHLSIVLFHAQQALEKSLKAVLFSRQIEFRRTHDLTELTQLLRQGGDRDAGRRRYTRTTESFCRYLPL